MGFWLETEQAQKLLNAPDTTTVKGLRDRAILAVMLGCGLRRSEVASLAIEHLQKRSGRWLIVNLVGKGSKTRSVVMAGWVKRAIDAWTQEARITEGPLFRNVNKGGKAGEAISEVGISWIIKRYGEALDMPQLAAHDLRRTFAKLSRKGGADLEQIQLTLGHASLTTTERYLGSALDLENAPSDKLGLG